MSGCLRRSGAIVPVVAADGALPVKYFHVGFDVRVEGRC